jgi:hypothetical protein
MPVAGVHQTRRAGGARRNVSYRIAFFRGAVEIPGWALNLSRGGLRAVVEDPVELGEELDVHIDEIEVKRRGQVVWIQDEPDGAIVGVAFDEHISPPPGVDLDASITIEPPPVVEVIDATPPAHEPGDPGAGTGGDGSG